MVAHEYAHAEAAYRQGDDTAYILGRLTFNPHEIVQRMLGWGMWLNVVLAFFNLIPVPPLDGSHVFYYLLPPGAGLKYRQLQAFGFLPVMVLVWAMPGVLQVLLWPAYHLMGVGMALVGGFAVAPGALPL